MEIPILPVGVFLFVVGATVGSFLNVVIARLPAGESIVHPRSRCPSCGHTIRWYDNIPILSFFVLRFRCRDCLAPISWRYPMVEALTGLLLVALLWRFGLSKELALHFVFGAALLAITFIDIDERIIPNVISLPGVVLGVACSFLWPGFWVESLIGVAAGGGLLLLLSYGYAWIRGREGMGMGDVKLLAMLGAWLGWRSLLFIALFASLQGLLAALALWLAGAKLKPPLPEEGLDADGNSPDDDAEEDLEEDQAPSFLGAAIPFGPFLSLAALEYLFLGEWFYGWLGGRF